MDEESENELYTLYTEYEILPGTAGALEKAGFMSKTSLMLLTKEMISSEKAFKDLPLAQRLLLAAATESLREKKENKEPENKEPENDDPLLAWQSFPSQPTMAAATAQQHVHSKSTAKDITSFVSLHPGQQNEAEFKLVDGHLSVSSKRTPREKLSLAQYMEAAIKMRCTIPPDQHNEYCEYISRIAQMARS